MNVDDKKVKIIKSRRKTVSLSVDDELCIVVRAPYFAKEKEIESFVFKNTDWISKAYEKKKAYLKKYDISTDEKENLKIKAHKYIPERVEYFSKLTGLYPSGIKITAAKKRFGSCSGKNSVCFSYYLMMYPKEAVDYVVLHELAHIKHHNHSREFYKLISEYMPDYKKREKILRS